MARKWAVAQTRSNAATTAIKNLRRQGFVYHNPLYSERTKYGFRRVQLFVNYLFVLVDGPMRSVGNTVGILRVIGHISDSFISDLKSRENEHGVVVLPKLSKNLQRGQKVAFKSSLVWSGVPAIYEGQSSSDRALVLVSLLGANRLLEFDEGDLVAA